MCARFAQFRTLVELAKLFGIEGPLPNAAPHYNIAPTQSALAVRRHPETGRCHLDPLRFGLVPHWLKEIPKAAPQVNARSETIREKPMFRDAFQRRRCLIPADAFYEWQGEGKEKQPYAIRRPDGGCFAFAGIWESWRDPAAKDQVTRSFAIVTTAANDALRPVHERMPVLVAPEDYALWLEGGADDAARLMRAAPDEALIAYRIGREVNAVRNDSAALLEPLAA